MNVTQINIHSDLIEACKKGDQTAQFKLYKLYSKAMFNICTRILGDRAQAEDALQEAFISAFSKLHTFQGRSSFGAWIKRIVVNKCLSQLNKKKVFFEQIDEGIVDVSSEQPLSGQREFSSEQVYQAIKELPQGCRVIFTLYQLEGYDHQEVSEILNISISTSKSQFHRAKKLLRQKLNPISND